LGRIRYLGILIAVLVLCCVPGAAQLSTQQRRSDFRQLAAAVSRNYAPYQWKLDAFQFDALQLKPWLDRIAHLSDDLAYYELCMEYIASLRDLHSGYYVHSDFFAAIGLGVDLYDGRPLIDSITRAELPYSRYPFEIGDEVISVDGQPVLEWVDRVSRLQSFANPRSTRRYALDQLFYRAQSVIPRAHEIGERAVVVVNRARTGKLESYEIPWNKTGTPLTVVGPVPTPSGSVMLHSEEEGPAPMAREHMAVRRAPTFKRLRGFGALAPVFNLPENFAIHYGRSRTDPIYSGTYQAGGYTIGYLRIPSFPTGVSASSLMLRAIDTEIAAFKSSTDGLVVDVMRNPGGDSCLTNSILTRLIPYPFRTIGDSIRPNLDIVDSFRSDYQDALDFGSDEVTLAYLKAFYTDINTAYHEYRGITGPLPICGFSLDLNPVSFAYEKPMLVLIDEFSTSSADAFPAVLQDAGRASFFGMATAGGGGLSSEFPVGFYAEGYVALSFSLGTRAETVSVTGLPPAPYLENIGVEPDIEADYMTRDNLLNGGRTFVDAFTQAMLERIRRAGDALPTR